MALAKTETSAPVHDTNLFLSAWFWILIITSGIASIQAVKLAILDGEKSH